jgi:hypothetical protein
MQTGESPCFTTDAAKLARPGTFAVIETLMITSAVTSPGKPCTPFHSNTSVLPGPDAPLVITTRCVRLAQGLVPSIWLPCGRNSVQLVAFNCHRDCGAVFQTKPCFLLPCCALIFTTLSVAGSNEKFSARSPKTCNHRQSVKNDPYITAAADRL